MNNPLVSVIVPVYNVEKYIRKCITSCLSQDYENIEVLVINDGTEDNSIKKIEDITDCRLKVFHKNNSGSSDSRNIGLEYASGEFVYFIDSDDWIESNLISSCMSLAKDKDIVYFNYFTDTIDEADKIVNRKKSVLHKVKDKDAEILNIVGFAWNKFYNKDFLNKNTLLFNKDLKLYEDIDFNLKCFGKTENIAFIDDTFYHYNNRQVPTLIKSYNDKNVQYFNVIQKTLKNFLWSRKYSEHLSNQILSDFILTATRHQLNTIFKYSKSSFPKRTQLIRLFIIKCVNINSLKYRKPNNVKEFLISKLTAYNYPFLLNILLSIKK